MCKYCEFNEEGFGNAIKFKKFKPGIENMEEKIGVIFNMQFLNAGPVISINPEDANNTENWFDFKINYCPRCGRQLREVLIQEKEE